MCFRPAGASTPKTCPECGMVNPAVAEKCVKCGAALPEDRIKCPHCGEMNDASVSECTECGTSLAGIAAGGAVPPASANGSQGVPKPPSAGVPKAPGAPPAPKH